MGIPFLYRFFYLALQFLASLVLANFLHPSAFGTFSLLLLNASLVSLMTGLGVEGILMHNLTNKKWELAEAHTFLWIALGLQVFLFGLLQGASFYFIDRTLLSHSTADYLLPECAYFLGLVLLDKFTALLYPLQLAKAANRIQFLCAGCFLAVLWFIGKNKGISLKTGFQLFSLQTLAQGFLLILLFQFRVKKPLWTYPQLTRLLTAIRLSLLVMGANIIQLLAYRIDFWMLNYYHSTSKVGIFAQANKLANLLWIVPNILAMLLMPRFRSLGSCQLKLVYKALWWFSGATTLGAILLAIVVFYAILTPDYRSGLDAFYLMLPGYFFWAMVLYYAAYASWKGHFVRNLLGSALCLLLILGADLLLIPRYSIRGAALANTIAYIATYLFYTQKQGKDLKVKGLFSFRKKEWEELKILVRG
ncbi:MAG: oligosaccharide flippase family protein [Flaviaesturariibacter sp.]|nr:oligosaccharide flippase family protein [Flaviaesturariibacter sp.]